MRPLIVFSGQGIARADGFNLTRRAKSLPEFRSVVSKMERSDRQNLDAILASMVAAGSSPAEWVSALRALCLKERRTTLRKRAHRQVFEALAAVARSRPVLHLTSNVDGLTTTFLVRDFGASWAPYHDIVSVDRVRADVAEIFERGAGIAHFPIHGEVGLYVSESGGDRLRTAYHHPEMDPDGTAWVSSLVVGPGRGLVRVERHLPTSRLAGALLQGFLRGGAVSLDDGTRLGEFSPADLLVIGYGAHGRGGRGTHPFERIVRGVLRDGEREEGATWTALVFGAGTSHHAVEWFETTGFYVVPYDDELSGRVESWLRDRSTRQDGCAHRATV